MDGPMEGRKDGGTERPSYRDARTHLKTPPNEARQTLIHNEMNSYPLPRALENNNNSEQHRKQHNPVADFLKQHEINSERQFLFGEQQSTKLVLALFSCFGKQLLQHLYSVRRSMNLWGATWVRRWVLGGCRGREYPWSSVRDRVSVSECFHVWMGQSICSSVRFDLIEKKKLHELLIGGGIKRRIFRKEASFVAIWMKHPPQ